MVKLLRELKQICEQLLSIVTKYFYDAIDGKTVTSEKFFETQKKNSRLILQSVSFTWKIGGKILYFPGK